MCFVFPPFLRYPRAPAPAKSASRSASFRSCSSLQGGDSGEQRLCTPTCTTSWSSSKAFWPPFLLNRLHYSTWLSQPKISYYGNPFPSIICSTHRVGQCKNGLWNWRSCRAWNPPRNLQATFTVDSIRTPSSSISSHQRDIYPQIKDK